MRETILGSSLYMVVPAVLVVGLCLVLNCFLTKQKQIPLRFDLTTLIILVTVLGTIWSVGNLAIENSRYPTSGRIMFNFYCMFTLPLVLFLRHVVETWRQNRIRRSARKSLTMKALGSDEQSPAS